MSSNAGTRYRRRPVCAWLMAPLMALLAMGMASGGGEPDARKHRMKMVRDQIERRGVKHPRVLEAMREVPRHRFVPERSRAYAYEDYPLPIGHGQTISQPYIVAAMTEFIDPEPGDRVLEIGTGSGYQAAVLARIVNHVFTIEIVPELAASAKRVLSEMGIENVTVRAGDGYKGWPEEAPFDAIVVTAAPDHIPEPLIRQLKHGGRMIIPVGPNGMVQELKLLEKQADGSLAERDVMSVRFVPLTRETD